MFKPVNHIVGSNRGVVLVITLTMVVLMFVMVLAVNRHVRLGIDAAQLFQERVKLSHMASSGVNIGRAVLIDDRINSEIDSIQEQWANAEGLTAIVNGFPFKNGGQAQVVITDILGRIQVNALVNYPDAKTFNETQRVLWYQLLQIIKFRQEVDDDFQSISIINSVKDWLDYGDDDAITGLDGAESDYYQDLMPPYACRNGPIIDINELALVKGIPSEIFYTAESGYGLSGAVTPFGMIATTQGAGFSFPGKININTASFFVLSALLPLEDAHLGAELYAYREEKSNGKYVNDLSDFNWYKRAPGCEELMISPDLITTQSDFFEISATAILNNSRMTKTVVVHREKDEESGKWRCRVLMSRG